MPHPHTAPPPNGSPQRQLPPATQPGAHRSPVPRVSSAALFADAQEVEIAHGRAVYRLRITSLGRLILTK